MTPKQVRIVTALIAGSSSILALGDKFIAMPGLPGWLTSSWPLILIGASIFNHVARILIEPDPKP